MSLPPKPSPWPLTVAKGGLAAMKGRQADVGVPKQDDAILIRGADETAAAVLEVQMARAMQVDLAPETDRPRAEFTTTWSEASSVNDAMALWQLNLIAPTAWRQPPVALITTAAPACCRSFRVFLYTNDMSPSRVQPFDFIGLTRDLALLSFLPKGSFREGWVPSRLVSSFYRGEGYAPMQ